jgi:hypothetical protein
VPEQAHGLGPHLWLITQEVEGRDGIGGQVVHGRSEPRSGRFADAAIRRAGAADHHDSRVGPGPVGTRERAASVTSPLENVTSLRRRSWDMTASIEFERSALVAFAKAPVLHHRGVLYR